MAGLLAVMVLIRAFLSIQFCLATTIPLYDPIQPPLAAIRVRNVIIPPRVLNATQAQIDQARAVVEAAIAQAAKLNEARVKWPARNIYKLAPAAVIKRDNGTSEVGIEPPPPLLNITSEIANAAALIAEVDAFASTNRSAPVINKRGSFWMENISRKGTIPWSNISPYQVLRPV